MKNLNQFPFSPARSPFFYGWAVLALGALGILTSIPGQTMGVSAFTDHLVAALPLTRSQLSFAYMFGTLGSGVLLTFAGRLYDRLGARVMAPATGICLGLVLLGLSRAHLVTTGLERRFDQVPPALVGFAVMVAGFFLLRFFGQGVLTMVSRNMVMKWFDRRRGFANGLMGLVVALGFSSAPLVLDTVIQRFGWSGAWAVLGVFTAGGFSVVALIFFRDNPEGCDLVPDGDTPSDADEPQFEPVRKQFTCREACATSSFWAFALTLAMSAFYVTAFTFHIVSIFKTAGMGRREALAVFLPASVIAVSIHLLAGWLSDRVKLKYLLTAMAIGLAISMTAIVVLDSAVGVGMIIIGNGLSGGLFGLLAGITWPKFYGREHLGAIGGFSMTLLVCASAIGPWLFSQSLAVTESYRVAAAGCLLLTLVLLIWSTRAENPQNCVPTETAPEGST